MPNSNQPTLVSKPAGRSEFIGHSDHGLVRFSSGDIKLASYNTLAVCREISKGKYNNPQNVTETFEAYQVRILGAKEKKGLLPELLEKMQKEGIGATSLQEASFLSTKPKIGGKKWAEFNEKCEKLIEDAGFSTLKSDNLSGLAKGGRECAIVYNKKVYHPEAVDGKDCQSNGDFMYALLKNQSTQEKFYFASIHLDYKTTSGSAHERSEQMQAFVQGVVKKIGATPDEQVIIGGDWNFPITAVHDNHFIGSKECTNINYFSDSGKFALADSRFKGVDAVKKGYDGFYEQVLKAGKFTADIFVQEKNGNVYIHPEGDVHMVNAHLVDYIHQMTSIDN